MSAILWLGADPGLRGAIAALALRPETERWQPLAQRLVWAGVYHARSYVDDGEVVAATVSTAAAMLAPPHGVTPLGGCAVEALGLRPGQSVQSTATAAANHARLMDGLRAALGADAIRTVTPQAVDRALGLPGVGRVARKARAVRWAADLLGAAKLDPAMLVPPRGRVASDGAADAMMLAAALASGRL